MDPEFVLITDTLIKLLPWIAIIVGIGVVGSILSTWLKIKNGYPLTSSWGLPLHPKKDDEAKERIRLLTQENAQLRAEVGSVKDRLAVIERIVTDDGTRLAKEIDNLQITRN